ncbi:hypothetical protein QBC38DRAFT_480428 [Podospora fimiseda]|uniref:Uncharacterized protein n=1 Tax=Podospora fimiseda TaxID=252190 RepID=A0AAN7BN54_9PEZI|nr:hypothetical protein QBC38DRAFT_480428 [Podospora fimiseda]
MPTTTTITTPTNPPSYTTTSLTLSPSRSFTPTISLRLLTPGIPFISPPFLPPPPTPIPIFSLYSSSDPPLYISHRPSRSSGSHYLTSSSSSSQKILSTTTYKFGPSRPPQIRLYSPTTTTTASSYFSSQQEESEADSFPITSTSLFSRTQTFKTHLGTFQWRYASRVERKQLSTPSSSSSLLLLERVTNIYDTPSSTKPEQITTTIGKFIRNEQTRTEEKSTKHSAGNGGILLLDLTKLDDHYDYDDDINHHHYDDDEKEREKSSPEKEKEIMTIMAVTTCLVMLKKEIDRRRT